MRKLLCRQKTQLLVHQGQQFVRSLGVPPFNGIQDACNITHADSPSFQVPDSIILGAKGGECK